MLKQSFFVRTVVEWNQLDTEVVRADSVESFRDALCAYLCLNLSGLSICINICFKFLLLIYQLLFNIRNLICSPKELRLPQANSALEKVWYLVVSIPDLCTLTYFSNGRKG